VDRTDGEMPSMCYSSPHRSGYCKSYQLSPSGLIDAEATGLTNMKLAQPPEPCSAVFSVTLPKDWVGSGPIEDGSVLER
jgi:hypothetical protein